MDISVCWEKLSFDSAEGALLYSMIAVHELE
jgi:hypothetical protein